MLKCAGMFDFGLTLPFVAGSFLLLMAAASLGLRREGEDWQLQKIEKLRC